MNIKQFEVVPRVILEVTNPPEVEQDGQKDGGISIKVLVDGREGVRFDIFKKRPRYYYFPLDGSGGDLGEEHGIDAVALSVTPLFSVLGTLEECLPAMLEHVGHSSLAAEITVTDILAAVAEVEVFLGIEPPQE